MGRGITFTVTEVDEVDGRTVTGNRKTDDPPTSGVETFHVDEIERFELISESSPPPSPETR